jgi:hypothetical protein
VISIDDLATLRRIVDEIKMLEVQRQAIQRMTGSRNDFLMAAQADIPRLITYVDRLLAEAEATSIASRRQLLATLLEIHRRGDQGTARLEAEDALLRFIDDEEITQAFLRICR